MERHFLSSSVHPLPSRLDFHHITRSHGRTLRLWNRTVATIGPPRTTLTAAGRVLASHPPAHRQTSLAMSTTLFTNARLVGRGDETYSVLVRGGRIAFIEASGSASPPPDAKVHDLAGSSFVAPSLIDAHTHFPTWAMAAKRIDFYTAKSAAEVLDRVRAWLPEQPDDGLFVVGQRMRVGEWPDVADMNRLALDSLETVRPLVLFFAGFHSLCANSAALKRIGFEPEGHSGVLEEADCFGAWTKIGQIPPAVLDVAVDLAARNAAAMGITEILDLEMDFNIDHWTRRVQKGTDVLRVRCGLYEQHLPSAIAAGYKTGDVLPNTQGLVTVGPHKIITDGSLGSRTACCHDPYPNEPENFGHFEYEPKTLKSMMEKAIDAGFALAVHAIGDKANQLTLQTFASLSKPALPGSSIEHAQLLTFSDIPLFTGLGLIASIQPAHMVDDRELCSQFWPGREHRAYAFKTLADAGVTLKLGSDAPVAKVDPWDALAVAIFRTAAGEEDLPSSAWHPEQCLTPSEAWRAVTSNGKISLEVGDRADVVVLPMDPLKADAKELRSMQVMGTMLGGRWTHFAM
ncbi:hypothetical protein AAT19DRAFT_15068 [Rhodotorula toruloides]|uniref:Amidohydrolase 3 domain-containing protein n=2 Tax=Rhodotorula toruloides TaxID=5286 RepID=A0A2T0A9L7_RHOTO|nr:hypothetical protein AAT19DRAFT_15068 [Rhodotorula toruloides]